MPKVMAVVHQLVKDTTLSSAERLKLMLQFDEVLGLGVADWKQADAEDFPEEAQRLLNEREEARKQRDWKTADLLRNKLAELGFLVEDTKSGGRLQRK